MSRKPKKPAIVAAADRDEANAFITSIGTARRALDRLQADLDEAVAAEKARFEQDAEEHRFTIATLEPRVQAWAEANRAALTGDGETKTARLAAGTISWRMTPPAVSLKGVEDVIKAIKERRWARLFLRFKVEVNKEAMLSDPDKAKQIPGVTIGQREEFIIEPTGVDLADREAA
jgi:phage host-nuclease inhibitor protein Gam